MSKAVKLKIYQAVISSFEVDSFGNIIYKVDSIATTSEAHSSAESVSDMCEMQWRQKSEFNESGILISVFAHNLYEDGSIEPISEETTVTKINNITDRLGLLMGKQEMMFKIFGKP